MWEQVLEDSSIIKEYKRRAEDQGIKIGKDEGIKIGKDQGIKIGEDRIIAKFRDTVIHLGEKRFGPADPASRAGIESIADIDRLAALNERIHEVNSWQELLT